MYNELGDLAKTLSLQARCLLSIIFSLNFELFDGQELNVLRLLQDVIFELLLIREHVRW